MRRMDWMLLAVALVAIAIGVALNGPICYSPLGNEGSNQCAEIRFPAELIGGAVVAAIAVGIVILRRLRRPS
jgi:predicted anti-sigma-YlaC factor YlaD